MEGVIVAKQPPSFIVATPDLFIATFKVVEGPIHKIMEEHEGLRGVLTALPLVEPEPMYWNDPFGAFRRLVDEIGFWHDFGGSSDEHPYDWTALAKLMTCYRLRRDSADANSGELTVGMSKYGGGIYRRSIVAFSGQEVPEDIAIAEIFESEAARQMHRVDREDRAGWPSFFGTPPSRSEVDDRQSSIVPVPH